MVKNFYSVNLNLGCLKMESKHRSWMRYQCWLAKNPQEISHFLKQKRSFFFVFGNLRTYESILRDSELLIIIYCNFLKEILCLYKKDTKIVKKFF